METCEQGDEQATKEEKWRSWQTLVNLVRPFLFSHLWGGHGRPALLSPVVGVGPVLAKR